MNNNSFLVQPISSLCGHVPVHKHISRCIKAPQKKLQKSTLQGILLRDGTFVTKREKFKRLYFTFISTITTGWLISHKIKEATQRNLFVSTDIFGAG